MKRSVALLTLVAATAACGGAGSAPRFETAHDWHVIVEPGQTLAAANVPFVSADRSESAPTRTEASLPRRGVLIWVEWARRRNSPSPESSYRRASPPLTVEDAAHTGDPEGMACPPAAQPGCFGAVRHLTARESGRDFDIWIFFGNGEPPTAQVAAANSELARLRFA